jgi:hypothetical protein
MMVIAMEGINYLGGCWRFGYPMKNKPVGYILKKRPEEHAPKKHQQDSARGIIIPGGSQVNNVGKNRYIHTPDYQWVCFG